MKYRKLGNSGLEVSEIGFGAWGIGGLTEGATSYGPVDDNESRKTLLLAHAKGITFYDTADVYGYGHSEELIGQTLKSVRKNIVIATKVGFLKHHEPQDFRPEHIQASLDGSLKRLKTDYVDLYQLHSPSIEAVKNNVTILHALESLKTKGKIRAFGISVKKPDDALIAVSELGFSCIQVNFNMIDQRILENGLVDLAREKGIGIIARTPLCFGFLSGAYSKVNFDPRDHRSSWSTAQLETWAKAPRLFTHLNNGKKRTLAQLALQFCLARESIAAVIPGMLKEQDVLENVLTSTLDPLTKDEFEEIKRIYKQNQFFIKPKS